jgi:transaldolase/glucose-6-phosphate isomerase
LFTCVLIRRLIPSQDAAIAELETAGHPLISISVADVYDLGQEFFRWEIATAVAGAIIGINPFDQPDVEASKIATRKLTDEYEQTWIVARRSSLL